MTICEHPFRSHLPCMLPYPSEPVQPIDRRVVEGSCSLEATSMVALSVFGPLHAMETVGESCSSCRRFVSCTHIKNESGASSHLCSVEKRLNAKGARSLLLSANCIIPLLHRLLSMAGVCGKCWFQKIASRRSSGARDFLSAWLTFLSQLLTRPSFL